MGESDAERFSLTNTRNQPIELLLSTGTITLPPNGRIELAAEAAASPQIQELCRRRLLTLRPVVPTLAPKGGARPTPGAEEPAAEGEEARDEEPDGAEDEPAQETSRRRRRRDQ